MLMLLKALFLLVLLYYLFKAARNLLRALQNDGRSREIDRNEYPSAEPRERWARQRSADGADRKDVEDAKWVDL